MDEFEELEFYSHTTTLLFHYLFDASSTPKNISEPFLDFLNEYLSGFDSLPIATLTKQETGNIPFTTPNATAFFLNAILSKEVKNDARN